MLRPKLYVEAIGYTFVSKPIPVTSGVNPLYLVNMAGRSAVAKIRIGIALAVFNV